MRLGWEFIVGLIVFLIGILFLIFLARPAISTIRSILVLSKTNPIYIFGLFGFTILISLFCLISSPFLLILAAFPISVSWVKLLEYLDDQFLDIKIGGWFEKQERLFFKITPNKSSNTSVADMEKFLFHMHSLYGNRTDKDLRTTGKFFDDFSIELLADESGVSLYIRIFKSSLQTFTSGASLYFPGVKFEQVPDPLLDILPDSYEKSKEIWKECDIGEFSLLGDTIYPTKNYSEISPASQSFKTTPIVQLINYLSNLDQGTNVIIQFQLRPQDIINSGKKKPMESKIAKMRKELSTNSAVSLGATGSVVNQLTPQELHLIHAVEQKINAPMFDTKIRFCLLGRKITGKRYMGGIMTYLKNFATEKQIIIPKPKSWDESANAAWGPIWDKLYWQPEVYKRRVDYYGGVLSRSFSIGGDTKYWDLYSLAALLHIPSIDMIPKIVDNSKLLQEKNTNINNNDTNYGKHNDNINNDNILEVPYISIVSSVAGSINNTNDTAQNSNTNNTKIENLSELDKLYNKYPIK